MCRVLEVSRSGYHAWAIREPSARAVSDQLLTGRIAGIHKQSGETYGSPRVHAELRLADGVQVGRKRVERLMRTAGLSGQLNRRRGRTTISVPGVRTAPDLVERDFDPTAVNRLWCADITYIRTWEGWLYLASVMDCYSRRIVGWAIADHMRKELVIEALTMAVARRRPDVGVVHHSDRGSQGGFNWSSQHSIERSCDEHAEAEVGSGGAGGDALAGAAARLASGASCAVLGGDRARGCERGGCRGGGCVGRGWRPVVSGGWRHADCHPGPVVGALSVVR